MAEPMTEKLSVQVTPTIPQKLNDSETTVDTTEGSASSQDNESNYLCGWRLHVLTLGLCVGIFIVNFEVSIVSTSLVAITDNLKHFSQSSWIITAYLLTYTSFMIILAKLSDVFGRKTVILCSMFTFTVFSGGCGAAQTMIQLIICRVFQGIGGSGVYSLTMVILFEMIPPRKYPAYSVLVTSLFALSMTLGPVFGGLINLHSTWRWVFLLNVPGGVVNMMLLTISIPKHFPNHGSMAQRRPFSIRRIDFIGGLLLLVAMTLHITGLEQAANLHAWTSKEVQAPLIISAPIWLGFFASQWDASKEHRQREPVFPWRFCENRVLVGLIVNSFLSGTVSTSCIILIPVRYQAAVGASPLQAGIRLIPLSVTIQIGAMLVAILARNGRMPPIYLTFVGAMFQVIGCVFLSRGSHEVPDWRGTYGIEAITGIGVGLGIGVVTLMTPFVIEKRDLSVATAAIVQFRFLGGATALAILTAVGNTWLRDVLQGVLTPEQLTTVFRTPEIINSFPAEPRDTVRGAFVKSFDLEMRILIGFSAAEFLFTLLMWQKKHVLLE